MSKGTSGFTLIEIVICLLILSILAGLATWVHLDSIERAKAVEASLALAEVVRLEHLRFNDTGTYASDLEELGFHLPSPLKYTQLFIQVRKDARGWSYMAFAMPLDGSQAGTGGWTVTQYASGKLQASMPGSIHSGVSSPCSTWSGWASMEGGRIDGEVSISSSSGPSPCAGMKVVYHGKK